MRTLKNVLLWPGRALIRVIDQRKALNGVPPLGRFLRGSVHAFVLFVGFVLVVSTSPAMTRPSPPARATPAVSSDTASVPTTPRSTSARPQQPAYQVARVIDGDTFELRNGQTVRVLGIDSCESDTPGGTEATARAQVLLLGRTVALTAERGVDTDRYGRLLRYVQADGHDFGVQMVRYDHTGVYQGDNDASDAYLQRLYAHDLDYAASPPSGRECGEPAPVVEDPAPVYVDTDDEDDDDRDRNWCRKWWC